MDIIFYQFYEKIKMNLMTTKFFNFNLRFYTLTRKYLNVILIISKNLTYLSFNW